MKFYSNKSFRVILSLCLFMFIAGILPYFIGRIEHYNSTHINDLPALKFFVIFLIIGGISMLILSDYVMLIFKNRNWYCLKSLFLWAIFLSLFVYISSLIYFKAVDLYDQDGLTAFVYILYSGPLVIISIITFLVLIVRKFVSKLKLKVKK